MPRQAQRVVARGGNLPQQLLGGGGERRWHPHPLWWRPQLAAQLLHRGNGAAEVQKRSKRGASRAEL